MAVIKVEDAPDQETAGPIPDDMVLSAKVVSIKPGVKPFKDDQGNEIPRFEFAFVVSDPSSIWHNTRIWGETGTKLSNHPKCRLYAWVKSLLSTDELPVGFELDTDNLVDGDCEIVVKQRQYIDKEGNPKIHNYVGDVLPPRNIGQAVPNNAFDEEPF